MTHAQTTGCVCVLALMACAAPSLADVGDPTLRTDHTHYPGEGAFQTVEDCVTFATAKHRDPQGRAIALFNWFLTHQWHLNSPQEWRVPGKTPGANANDYDMVVMDANRGRFSYGYGLCGTVHSWNEPYWRALGMQARRRAFPGHVNSEVYYKDSWHAFDTDMAGLVFRPDGVVAGYDDVKRDPSIVKPNANGVPCYPFAWPNDFNGMKKGWNEIAKGGKWYALYNSGYVAMPGVVRLRRGETFTRYYDRDVFGGPSKRRFWHVQEGGPHRNWTFFDNGEPKHDGANSNSRGNATYANAVFDYKPDLTASGGWEEGVVEASQNVFSLESFMPALRSRDGELATVVFNHFAPYVICGDPVDDKDPMTGKATDGLVVTGKTSGQVKIEVSVDGGQSWTSTGKLKPTFKLDLTEHVKGRYGWWVRFTITADGTLTDLRFVTTCQMNVAMYPRLTSSGSRVSYRAGSRGVVPVQPNFGLDEKAVGAFEVRSMRSDNLRYTPRSAKQRTAYTTTNNKPGQVVFKVDAPQPHIKDAFRLVEVRAAARYRVRVPQPKGCDFHLDLSTDGGKTWQRMAKAHNAPDNEYSSGWVYGKADVSAAKVKSALVRVNLYAGGYQTGLIDFEAFGLHETYTPSSAKVTYGWKEGGKDKTHTQSIPAGASSTNWTVPTGGNVRDSFVRIEAK